MTSLGERTPKSPEKIDTCAAPALDRAILKGNKAIKQHSIQRKPVRKPGWQGNAREVAMQNREEYNPFLKHCWMLVAEGQFYNGDFLQAAATYSYIARHYATEPEVVAAAHIGRARCYAEMGWLYETESTLERLEKNGFPAANRKDYDRVYADFLVKSNRTEQAIPALKKVIDTERNRRQRTRMRYLLGQLLTEAGRNDEAYREFGRVASANPPYELEFAARIRQAEVLPPSRWQQVLSMLRRMSKSDKNKNYLDQVYMAIGDVYMSRRDTAQAIAAYAQGVEKSVQNGLDLAICQIKLGDIYFTQKDYVRAQPCFSDAISAMPQEYKLYCEEHGIRFEEHTEFNDKVIADADILYMTRVQKERFSDLMEYERVKNVYILRRDMLSLARPNMKILHPLPRVNEIAYDVDDSPHAYYIEQARNGLFAREAIFCHCLGITLDDITNDKTIIHSKF